MAWYLFTCEGLICVLAYDHRFMSVFSLTVGTYFKLHIYNNTHDTNISCQKRNVLYDDMHE